MMYNIHRDAHIRWQIPEFQSNDISKVWIFQPLFVKQPLEKFDNENSAYGHVV